MNTAAKPTLLPTGNRDPADDLLTAQIALRNSDWFRLAGIDERWPIDTDEAAQLLSVAGEYDVDPAGLVDLITRNLLPSPATGEAGPEWSAIDLCNAGGLLEGRQQWKVHPSGHDSKKHHCTLLLEVARQAGEVEAIVRGNDDGQGQRFDVRHLLALLDVCDAREGRSKVIALLRAVLEVDHGVII